MTDDFDFGNLPEPPPEAYDLVRRRVLASIRRRRHMRTAMQALAATAACIVLAWTLRLYTEKPATLTPPAPKLAAAPPPPATVARVRAARHKQTRRRAAVPLVARVEKRPLLVKMQTDDPNVVILWMVD